MVRRKNMMFCSYVVFSMQICASFLKFQRKPLFRIRMASIPLFSHIANRYKRQPRDVRLRRVEIEANGQLFGRIHAVRAVRDLLEIRVGVVTGFCLPVDIHALGVGQIRHLADFILGIRR